MLSAHAERSNPESETPPWIAAGLSALAMTTGTVLREAA